MGRDLEGNVTENDHKIDELYMAIFTCYAFTDKD